MAYMHKKVALILKLPQLQNLIKRDPEAYKEEFMMQKRHFESELEIFRTRPTKDSDRFTELVTFMCHVANCYKDITSSIPMELMQLLEENAMTLHPDVRAKLFTALIMLRNKGMLDPLLLLRLSFKLFCVTDKALRVSLSEYIINDIKSINQKRTDNKLNRSIQAILYNIVQEENATSARKTVEILAELYRKRVWTDARTVNVVAAACVSSITRVCVTAVSFFLGIETKMMEDDDDEKASNPKDGNTHQHSKKTRKRLRQAQKIQETSAKTKRDKDKKAAEVTPLFPALMMIHDPQVLAEKLFKKLRQTGERFEVKLLLMNFISRLIGCHKLILLSFNSFLQRYLTSHQQDVTRILAYLIQGCHDLIPPEDLVPLVKAIAYNFITERCSTEVLAVGLNAVREIFSRVPSILREPDMGDFVQDLALYGKKAHKSVMVAAHSIVNLVREVYPALLRKSDRGKFHNPDATPSLYGQQHTPDGVQGAELLEAYEQGDIYINSDGEVVWKSDEKEGGGCGSDDDDGDEWQDCEEDDDEEEEEGGEWQDCEDDDDDDDGDEEVEDDDDGDEDSAWVDVDESDGADDVSQPTINKAGKRARDQDDEDDNEEGDDDDDEEKEGEEEEDEDEDDEGSSSFVDKAEIVPVVTHSLQPRQQQGVRGRVDARRLLTDEDFAMLARLKEAQKQRLLDPKSRRRSNTSGSNADSTEGDDDDAGDANLPYNVDPSSLSAGVKTQKTTKIERITHVLEGRKESKFEHTLHAGGLTNKEKLRKKNFVMVRKGKSSVSGKMTKSNSDQRYEKMTAREQFGRDRRKRRRT